MNQFVALLDHVPTALLVIFRIGGLAIYGPVIGASIIPGRIKVMLAVILGLAVYPVLTTQELGVGGWELNVWSLGPAIAMELLVGLIIGFLASLPLLAVQIGGLMMGHQMGLGFARFFNPAMEDDADIIGQMLFFMALAGFLLLGGLEMMVLAVLHSFHHIPLATNVADGSLLTMLAGVLTASYELALRVAAPLLTLIFLETVAMGFLSKTVPQLNILSLGFPMRILVGLVIVALVVGVIDEVFLDWFNEMTNLTFTWIENR